VSPVSVRPDLVRESLVRLDLVRLDLARESLVLGNWVRPGLAREGSQVPRSVQQPESPATRAWYRLRRPEEHSEATGQSFGNLRPIAQSHPLTARRSQPLPGRLRWDG
jgi:hypothetical protein